LSPRSQTPFVHCDPGFPSEFGSVSTIRPALCTVFYEVLQVHFSFFGITGSGFRAFLPLLNAVFILGCSFREFARKRFAIRLVVVAQRTA